MEFSTFFKNITGLNIRWEAGMQKIWPKTHTNKTSIYILRDDSLESHLNTCISNNSFIHVTTLQPIKRRNKMRIEYATYV